MKAKILQVLRETDGYVSGQQLCEQFHVSRTAVWKAINQLREMGYEFEVDGPVDDTHTRIRLVTSWATPETAVEEFLADLALCH